ncbi:MAG: PepSY domain-containing protein [Sporichthyaceae bacterium]|nr:PepSY domain-containing protein [Sporichthyaceae bacterium]
MNRTQLLVAGGALALAAIVGTTGMAIASNDNDRPLSGSNLERASQAALEHTGGGVVVETETGDDGAAYGVEVRLPDGRVVEVHLDERFAVVGSEADEDGSGAEDS